MPPEQPSQNNLPRGLEIGEKTTLLESQLLKLLEEAQTLVQKSRKKDEKIHKQGSFSTEITSINHGSNVQIIKTVQRSGRQITSFGYTIITPSGSVQITPLGVSDCWTAMIEDGTNSTVIYSGNGCSQVDTNAYSKSPEDQLKGVIGDFFEDNTQSPRFQR